MTNIDQRYPTMKFGDYEFQEYPKWLGKNKYGADIIAISPEDEEKLKKEVVGKAIDPAEDERVKQDPPPPPKPAKGGSPFSPPTDK